MNIRTSVPLVQWQHLVFGRVPLLATPPSKPSGPPTGLRSAPGAGIGLPPQPAVRCLEGILPQWRQCGAGSLNWPQKSGGFHVADTNLYMYTLLLHCGFTVRVFFPNITFEIHSPPMDFYCLSVPLHDHQDQGYCSHDSSLTTIIFPTKAGPFAHAHSSQRATP